MEILDSRMSEKHSFHAHIIPATFPVPPVKSPGPCKKKDQHLSCEQLGAAGYVLWGGGLAKLILSILFLFHSIPFCSVYLFYKFSNL